jgi:hypothetical protein
VSALPAEVPEVRLCKVERCARPVPSGQRRRRYCDRHNTAAARTARSRVREFNAYQCCSDARAANPRVLRCAQHKRDQGHQAGDTALWYMPTAGDLDTRGVSVAGYLHNQRQVWFPGNTDHVDHADVWNRQAARERLTQGVPRWHAEAGAAAAPRSAGQFRPKLPTPADWEAFNRQLAADGLSVGAEFVPRGSVRDVANNPDLADGWTLEERRVNHARARRNSRAVDRYDPSLLLRIAV